VETFSAAWLALREPADHAARSAALVPLVIAALARPAQTAADASEVTVLDLGSGAGSNLRYLAERLPLSQRWRLVDHDAALLRDALEQTRRWAADSGYEARTSSDTLDIRRDSRQDLLVLDAALFDSRDEALLVTGAALLDLASHQWLATLAARCAAAQAVALFALSYDGRIACEPADPDDDLVRQLVNRHQHTDKGFGPAAGPDATTVAASCFEAAGYQVQRAASDWRLGPESAKLQHELVAGWAHAAAELEPARRAAIEAWRDRRFAHIAGGLSRIVVGHEDLIAWPRP
jgi:SAM-dependent methyltransferase